MNNRMPHRNKMQFRISYRDENCDCENMKKLAANNLRNGKLVVDDAHATDSSSTSKHNHGPVCQKTQIREGENIKNKMHYRDLGR